MSYADRVKETTTTTGPDTFVTAGAETRFRTFASGHAVGASGIPYCCESLSGAEWEIGLGTLVDATHLSRDTILASSNSGAIVSFSAGTKYLFETIPGSVLSKMAAPDAVAVTTVADPSVATILIEVGGAFKRITMNNFLTSLGTSVAQLNAAAALSDADLISVVQDGTNEVKVSLSTLKAYTGGGAAAATGVTMTGPTTGLVSVASSNFTIGVTPVGGTITGTVVVTPSDNGGGGTFTPTTVSLTSASPSATFTYTPSAAAGARTISVTNNGGLTNPSNITYTSTVSDTTAPTFSSAQVANASPTIVAVTMSETLANIAPVASAFTVSGGKTVSSVSISGAVVSLTCSAAYAYGDTITVQYTKPGSGNMLQDAAGNLTASFGPSTVTNNVITVPGAPTIGTATAGDASASVAFTAPASNGGSSITGYTVTSTPGSITATGTTSPISVTGLTNSTAYTFTVHATNSVGNSAESAASNSVTPAAASNVAYTISGYNGNAVRSTIDASAITASGSLKGINPGGTTQTTVGIYWNVNQTSGGAMAASAKSGWGTSSTNAPAEITQAQNTAAGSSINGMTPMTKGTAFGNNAYLWVSAGSGTTTWYFWIKPVDGAAYCVNPSGTTVTGA
jgi:trimeric autotransporter adhesin